MPLTTVQPEILRVSQRLRRISADPRQVRRRQLTQLAERTRPRFDDAHTPSYQRSDIAAALARRARARPLSAGLAPTRLIESLRSEELGFSGAKTKCLAAVLAGQFAINRRRIVVSVLCHLQNLNFLVNAGLPAGRVVVGPDQPCLFALRGEPFRHTGRAETRRRRLVHTCRRSAGNAPAPARLPPSAVRIRSSRLINLAPSREQGGRQVRWR